MLVNEETGGIEIVKVPSTPSDPSGGFVEATLRILKRSDVTPGQLAFVVHGTTVATNSIIEGKVARTGFVTTDGFRDMLEIARQIRPSLYDLQFDKPPPLVPRYLCFGVPERLDARGKVLKELDEERVREVARELGRQKVESIAVCLLHSYVNPAHEARIKQILQEELGDISLSISSELAPEFREYFRASTTVVNAAIRPVVARYLQGIEKRLRAEELTAELLVMQSNGGVLTFEAAAERPVFMVESGPAAGVIAASYLAASLGHKDAISFDMGGTTAKVGLVQDGRARITRDYEVGAAARAGTGSARGSGYPIRTPVIDLVEIGAGGGSIAWVDSGGVLRVGPHSAGADPGPACYGQGGKEPTITDANLVLGRLNPDYFLGGEVKLHVELARAAIENRCARPLGIDVLQAANGIIEIANSAMVNALRLISVQRGYDPRDFALIGFGGAGPVHANRLAAENDIPTTIIPMSPGITCAMGLLVTDLQHDYSATLLRRADAVEPARIEEHFKRLEASGRAALKRDGVPASGMKFLRLIDMRYVGQSYELPVPLASGAFGATRLDKAVSDFHAAHERAYGHAAPAEPVEIVNLRLTSLGAIQRPTLREIPNQPGASPATALKGTRQVYFAESGGMVKASVYDRYRLVAGAVLKGPAIVEEMDSTTVIHPGYQGSVDRFGNIVLTRGRSR
ncbi:MAG: hydantoinase/oxoprolinase family protein [SAR202 cluster bacterium]|nr:hydantoinase/oxoprolinase family protein [SAR202 cluster bacterium]